MPASCSTLYEFDDIHTFVLVANHMSCCFGMPAGMTGQVYVAQKASERGLPNTNEPIERSATSTPRAHGAGLRPLRVRGSSTRRPASSATDVGGTGASYGTGGRGPAPAAAHAFRGPAPRHADGHDRERRVDLRVGHGERSVREPREHAQEQHGQRDREPVGHDLPDRVGGERAHPRTREEPGQ